MITSWILLAIAAGLASNLFNILNRYILKQESDSSAYGWFSEAVRIIIALIILPFDFYVNWNLTTLWLFLLLGTIEIISIYVFMKMHAYTHLSISTIISRTRLIWVPIIMYFLFGHTLQTIDYIGIGILFLGLSIAVSPHKLFLDNGILYAYVSAFVLGFLAVTMKLASPQMSTSIVLIGMSLLAFLFYPIVMKDSKRRLKQIVKTNIKQKIIACCANTAAMYLYVLALKIGDVSKVTAIYQGMMVVSIVAGIVFLGEKTDVKKKLIGAAITLIGVFMLTSL